MRSSKFEVRSSNCRPAVARLGNGLVSNFELRTSKFILVLTAVLALACNPDITREKWQQMSQADKTLYVSSLIGGEKARQQKGGQGRTYSAPPEQYVKQIDAAYERGDHRDVATIFSDMADPK